MCYLAIINVVLIRANARNKTKGCLNMPGTMIHLFVAKKTRPQGNILFFLGNIAPDAVDGRHNKEITHFRNMKNRQPALIALAKNSTDDFSEGVLLHLFVDWKWETGIMKKYDGNMSTHEGFIAYRDEMSLVSSYAFHNTHWAKQLWADMDSFDVDSYGNTPGVSVSDVKKYLADRYKWHNENITEPSKVFSPNLIEEFVSACAEQYSKWRISF